MNIIQVEITVNNIYKAIKFTGLFYYIYLCYIIGTRIAEANFKALNKALGTI